MAMLDKLEKEIDSYAKEVGRVLDAIERTVKPQKRSTSKRAAKKMKRRS